MGSSFSAFKTPNFIPERSVIKASKVISVSTIKRSMVLSIASFIVHLVVIDVLLVEFSLTTLNRMIL